MAQKEKINTQKAQEGLQNPFSALDSSHLPPPSLGIELTKTTTEKKNIKSKGRVVLRRETAHRGGKTVVVAGEFEPWIPLNEIEELGRSLKKFCSCGGAIKDREIEIQGEQTAKIRQFLTEAGFRVVGVK